MRKVLGTLATWVSLAFIVLWSILTATTAVIGYLFYRPLGDLAQRAWGAGIAWLLGIKAEYRNLERLPASAVLAPNHESMFDIILLAAMPYPKRWISKKEVGYIPFIGWAMKAMGCYFVSRDRTGKDLNVMRQVEDGLRQGHSVIIFPEGTRTRTGELLPFKKGAFRTAMQAEVPICPIAIGGTRLIAPPGKLPSRRGHRVCIQIGQPLRAAPGESLEAFMARFRAYLVENLESTKPIRP